ncbi:MAG: aminoglycoside phosphotransferase family protein [Bacteroidales bacterium]|nr:aminoglycoside phosphotransferase family protein [Bacteroidales bacterium]
MDTAEIIRNFALVGNAVSVKPLGDGFINDTFIAVADSGRRYILQRKNKNIFPDVPAMMDNIVAVTEHIKGKVADPMRETLTVVPALDGKPYWEDQDGEFWAVTDFIEGSKTFDIADTPDLARQGGLGLGHFQALLSDFHKPLAEVIKGFHNIRWRFVQWDASIAADKAGRVKDLATEISWIESRRQRMLDFWKMVEDGILPMRVTHNDTKLSNFLFDAATGKVLCAIDLDTVMSSTALNDVGDAIRSYANNTFEDDPDYSKVGIRLDMYEAYMQGYLSEVRDFLSDSEKEWLAFAPLYITYEQVLRFLMDYIDGDVYYKIKYPEHNLVRTRSQETLLESMEAEYDRMKEIVASLL